MSKINFKCESLEREVQLYKDLYSSQLEYSDKLFKQHTRLLSWFQWSAIAVVVALIIVYSL